MAQQEGREKSWVRLTEGRLYAYPVLRTMYKDVKAQSLYFYPLTATEYDGIGICGKGQTSNPSFRNAMQQESLEFKCDEQLMKYLKETELIDSIKELSSVQEQEFLKMKYFDSYAMSTIMRQLNVSARLYYKIKKNVVARSAVIFGYLKYDEYIKMLA